MTASRLPVALDWRARYPESAAAGDHDAASGQPSPAPSILLIAPDPAVSALRPALQASLAAQVQSIPHRRASVLSLPEEEFSLILLDENLAAASPDATDALYLRAGSAPVLEINFALCDADRVLRQVRAALRRRVADHTRARTAAAASLHNQLNGSLSGLLLESQLARQKANPELAPVLDRIVRLAADLRDQLRS